MASISKPGFLFNLRSKVLLFTISIILILLLISQLITSTLVSQNLRMQLSDRATLALENLGVWFNDSARSFFEQGKLLASSQRIVAANEWQNPLFLALELEDNQISKELDFLKVDNFHHGWSYEIIDNPDNPYERIPAVRNITDSASGVPQFISTASSILLVVELPITGFDGEIARLTIGRRLDMASLEDLLFISGSDQLHILKMGSFLVSTFDPPVQKILLQNLPEAIEADRDYDVAVNKTHYITKTRPLLNEQGQTIGQLVVQFSDTANREMLENLTNTLNLSAFGAFVAFSLFSIFFTSRVTDNIKNLAEKMVALGEGKYEEEISIKSGDEVELLSNSFNELRVKLKDRTDALINANEDLDIKIQEIEALNNVLFAISSGLSMDEVFHIIASEAGKRIPVDYAFIALNDETSGKMRLIASFGVDKLAGRKVLFYEGPNFSEKLSKQKKSIVELIASGSEYNDIKWLADNGLNVARFFPMISDKKFLGTLCFASFSSEKKHYEKHTIDFLDKLSTEVSVALQRFRLNEELQLIEGRLSRLFESLRDGIFQTDAEGEIVFFNKAAQKMFDYTDNPEEPLKLQSLFVNSERMEKLLIELEKSTYVSGFEARMSSRSGKAFYAELSVTYTKDEVGQRGIEGVVRDVTLRKSLEKELQRSEEFLRQVIEGTTNAIFTINDSGELTFMNKQLVEVTGLDEKSLHGKRLDTLLDNESREKLKNILAEVLQAKGTVSNVEINIDQVDGQSVVGLLSLAPLEGQGDHRVAVGALANISEIKKLESRLIRSERLASMGQIAASVAHEINNPLGIVLGFTQDLISEKNEHDPDLEPLNTIKHETERCTRIVKDLLDLARADSSQRRAVDLESLIEKTLTLYKLHLRDGRITLIKELSRTPFVYGDEHQLQQVLMNVIINALHAMAESEGELHISMSPKVDLVSGKALAVIQIRDTGSGIQPEHLERIFDPFFTTRKKGGSGLGLFIVHRLIEAHDGHISIESEPGKGTICTIHLPTMELEHESKNSDR